MNWTAADGADELLRAVDDKESEALVMALGRVVEAHPKATLADLTCALAMMTANLVSPTMTQEQSNGLLSSYGELVHRLLRKKGVDLPPYVEDAVRKVLIIPGRGF